MRRYAVEHRTWSNEHVHIHTVRYVKFLLKNFAQAVNRNSRFLIESLLLWDGLSLELLAYDKDMGDNVCRRKQKEANILQPMHWITYSTVAHVYVAHASMSVQFRRGANYRCGNWLACLSQLEMIQLHSYFVYDLASACFRFAKVRRWGSGALVHAAVITASRRTIEARREKNQLHQHELLDEHCVLCAHGSRARMNDRVRFLFSPGHGQVCSID